MSQFLVSKLVFHWRLVSDNPSSTFPIVKALKHKFPPELLCITQQIEPGMSRHDWEEEEEELEILSFR